MIDINNRKSSCGMLIGLNKEVARQNLIVRAWAGPTKNWDTELSVCLPFEKLFYGIPFRLRLQVFRKRIPLQIAVTPRRTSQFCLDIKRVELSNAIRQKDQEEFGVPYPSFVEFSLTVRDPSIDSILFDVTYKDHKVPKDVFQLPLRLKMPFNITTTTRSVGTVGFLCQTQLQNCLEFPARNLILTFDMPSYLVSPSDCNETEPVDVLSPGKAVSKVFQMEFASKHIQSVQNDDIPVSIRWLSYEDSEFEVHNACVHKIVLHAVGDGFPLQIEMIGSPQIQSVMKPFQVKIAIHNSSKSEVRFTVDVTSDTERGVVPYGNHFFESTLQGGESPRFDFWFVGLKQGLLLYPEFILEIADGPKSVVNLDCGVLIC